MKNIKILGLLAVSAMALIAFVGTASASAAETKGSFTAGAEKAELTTRTIKAEVFKITGAEVKCGITKFVGSTEGTKGEDGLFHSTTQNVHPVYEECEAFGFKEGVSVTTAPAGCIYTLSADTTGEPEANMADVVVSGCTSGIIIKVSNIFATCEVNVGNQTVHTGVSYRNTVNNGAETAGGVAVKSTATGITANVTKSSGLCPLTTGVHEGAKGASYEGEAEVHAKGTTITYTQE